MVDLMSRKKALLDTDVPQNGAAIRCGPHNSGRVTVNFMKCLCKHLKLRSREPRPVKTFFFLLQFPENTMDNGLRISDV